MTPARRAVHLDPANELAEFQSAARSLVTHGLVTERYPQPGALALVRRFEEPLRNEFSRLCHWRLDLGPDVRPAPTAPGHAVRATAGPHRDGVPAALPPRDIRLFVPRPSLTGGPRQPDDHQPVGS